MESFRYLLALIQRIHDIAEPTREKTLTLPVSLGRKNILPYEERLERGWSSFARRINLHISPEGQTIQMNFMKYYPEPRSVFLLVAEVLIRPVFGKSWGISAYCLRIKSIFSEWKTVPSIIKGHLNLRISMTLRLF